MTESFYDGGAAIIGLTQRIVQIDGQAEGLAAAARLAALLGREPTTVLVPDSAADVLMTLLQSEAKERGLWDADRYLGDDTPDPTTVSSDFPGMPMGCRVLVPSSYTPDPPLLWEPPDSGPDEDASLVAVRLALTEVRPLSRRCAIPLACAPRPAVGRLLLIDTQPSQLSGRSAQLAADWARYASSVAVLTDDPRRLVGATDPVEALIANKHAWGPYSTGARPHDATLDAAVSSVEYIVQAFRRGVQVDFPLATIFVAYTLALSGWGLPDEVRDEDTEPMDVRTTWTPSVSSPVSGPSR